MLPISRKPEIGALVYKNVPAAKGGRPRKKCLLIGVCGFLTRNLVSLMVWPTKSKKNGE